MYQQIRDHYQREGKKVPRRAEGRIERRAIHWDVAEQERLQQVNPVQNKEGEKSKEFHMVGVYTNVSLMTQNDLRMNPYQATIRDTAPGRKIALNQISKKEGEEGYNSTHEIMEEPAPIQKAEQKKEKVEKKKGRRQKDESDDEVEEGEDAQWKQNSYSVVREDWHDADAMVSHCITYIAGSDDKVSLVKCAYVLGLQAPNLGHGSKLKEKGAKKSGTAKDETKWNNFQQEVERVLKARGKMKRTLAASAASVIKESGLTTWPWEN